MFREPRKVNRQICEKEAKKVLAKGKFGFLATVGDDEYPYCVPVNYIYYKDAIYIHCSKKGHKIDNIKNSNKVSFGIVTYEDIDEEEVSTDYESVIVFGKAKLVEQEEKGEIFNEFLKILTPTFKEASNYIEKHGPAAEVIKLEIEHMTGKARYDKCLRKSDI